MAPKFTPFDLLWILFVGLYQFILVPVVALLLLHLVRKGKTARTGALAGLFVVLMPLIGAQLLVVLPQLQILHWHLVGPTQRLVVPLVFLVVGIVITAALLNTPKQRQGTRVFRQICKIAAIASLALLLAAALFRIPQLINRQLPQQTDVVVAPVEKPQFYLPSRPIKGTQVIDTKLIGDDKVQITYRDAHNQTITLTETTNAITSSVFCNEAGESQGNCHELGKTPTGGLIVGDPSRVFINGTAQDGYSSVRAVMGTSLIEIGQSTTAYVMQDDFVDFFDSFKRVGKDAIK